VFVIYLGFDEADRGRDAPAIYCSVPATRTGKPQSARSAGRTVPAADGMFPSRRGARMLRTPLGRRRLPAKPGAASLIP